MSPVGMENNRNVTIATSATAKCGSCGHCCGHDYSVHMRSSKVDIYLVVVQKCNCKCTKEDGYISSVAIIRASEASDIIILRYNEKKDRLCMNACVCERG